MSRTKSILTEAKQIDRAVTLIHLGARLQVLESETDLSYERLLRLYKEVAGKSPSKGQLPFSTDWFMTWQPNIHSSLFYNIHSYLQKTTALDDSESIIKAYELYCAEVASYGVEPLLSITRAWRLVRFVDQDGRLVALRADFTSSIARVAASFRRPSASRRWRPISPASSARSASAPRKRTAAARPCSTAI